MSDPRLTFGQQVYGFFKQKGLPDHQAAALAGNFAWEGGGKTDLVNPGDNWKNSPKSPHSFGIAQWNDRLPGLIDYAKRNGANIPQGDLRDVNYLKSIAPQLPLQTQLGYAWEEMQGSEKRAFDTLKGGSDLRSATAGAISYHRPAGWSWGNPMAGHGFQGRMQLADRIMRLGAADLANPPQENYDMYGETVKPAAAPITTGSNPQRTSAMPTDPVTGQWVPETVIKSQYDRANQFWDTPRATSGLGAIAEGLGGFFGQRERTRGDDMVRGNQGLQSDRLRSAMASPDLRSQAQALLQSGIPDLEMRGAQLVQQLGLKRAEQQEKFDMFNKLMGQPQAGPQPVAPSASPSAVAPGTPGMSPGQPADGLPTQAPQGTPFDKRRLGMAVAAGLISPEAAKLLQEDKKYDDAFDAQAGKDYAEEYKTLRDSARKLQGQVATYDIMESLIKNPATLQGWGSNASLQLRRVADTFGIKTDGLQPTQVMQALAGELALQLRNPAGGAGMPGAMSDADRQFLTNMTAGIGNSPEANLFLIQMRKRMAEREIQVARFANNYVANNNGRLDHKFSNALQQWSDKNPLFNPKEKEVLAGQHAQVATEAPAPQAAAPASPSVDEIAKVPVGTVVNGARKVGPNQWVREDAAPAAPPPAPKPQETPAQRAARKREENARATAEAPQKAAAEAARVQSEFNTDAQSMPPLALVQKYDALRWQLSEPQRIALNAALEKATAR